MIINLMDKFGKKEYFNCIVLASAYHQVRISAGDTHITDLLINKGLFEYIIILFRAFYNPATLLKLINLAFTNIIMNLLHHINTIY